MTILRSPSWRKAIPAVSVALLCAAGCGEDGKTAPDDCGESLDIYDIKNAPPANAGDQPSDCVTAVGDAYSPPADASDIDQTVGGAPSGSETSEAGAGGG